MLVLSRRADEKIVFPNVGITVKILRVKGNVAKIGIDAPAELQILRNEIQGTDSYIKFTPMAEQSDAELKLHSIRNQLNVVYLGLHLYRQQAEAGMTEEANLTFLKIFDDFEKMDHDADQPKVVENPKEKLLSRILLVEDEPRQRELLSGFLSMRGCDVSTASDAKDALSWLKNHEWPDLLLLDMKLTDGNGSDIVKAVRAKSKNPNMKIIAVSGSSPEEYGIETGENGVDFWFPKPLNPEALVEKIIQIRPTDYTSV